MAKIFLDEGVKIFYSKQSNLMEVDRGWCLYWTSNPVTGVFGIIQESSMNKGIRLNSLFSLSLPLYFPFLVILASPIILGYLYLKLAQKWHSTDVTIKEIWSYDVS